jgi:hypothetical protein
VRSARSKRLARRAWIPAASCAPPDSSGVHQKQKSRASTQARLRISEIYSESLYRILLVVSPSMTKTSDFVEISWIFRDRNLPRARQSPTCAELGGWRCLI